MTSPIEVFEKRFAALEKANEELVKTVKKLEKNLSVEKKANKLAYGDLRREYLEREAEISQKPEYVTELRKKIREVRDMQYLLAKAVAVPEPVTGGPPSLKKRKISI